MVEVTQLPCSAHPHGDTHHLVPRPIAGKFQRMVCAYCHRSEQAIREEAEKNANG